MLPLSSSSLSPFTFFTVFVGYVWNAWWWWRREKYTERFSHPVPRFRWPSLPYKVLSRHHFHSVFILADDDDHLPHIPYGSWPLPSVLDGDIGWRS